MCPNLNFCIVGFGRAGRFHLESLMSLQKVSLKYIVDPDISEKKVPQGLDPGIRLVQELMPALEDPGLDAVIVASPTACHFDQIGRALQAGKHVFSEKPLGHSLKEITNSYQLAREKQKALYLGFQRRYDRNFSVLKSKIEQIATLRLYRASSRDNPKPALEYLKISGNIFHDMLIHDFDMLVYLLGPKVPNLITSMAYAHDEEIAGIPDFDHVMVTLMYADGLICSIDTSRDASYGYDQRIEVFGVQGMATARNQLDHTVEMISSQGSSMAPINYSFPERYRDSYREEIASFVDGILNQNYYNVTEDECVMSHLMAEAAAGSAKSQQVIDFKAYYRDMLAGN